MATRRLFDGATIEIGQVPLASPAPAGNQMWIKVSGIWKQATMFIKVAGVWKLSSPKIKVSGTWTG